MYALFKLGELHEAQCVRYSFPKVSENLERMERLRWRKQEIIDFQQQMANKPPGSNGSLEVKWTNTNKLRFVLDEAGTRVKGVNLWKEGKVIKTIDIHDESPSDTEPYSPSIFS